MCSSDKASVNDAFRLSVVPVCSTPPCVSWIGRAALLTTVLVLAPVAPSSANIVESLGSASIAHAPGSDTWTLTAGGATLTLTLHPSKDFQVRELQSPTGRRWLSAPMADTTVVIDGRSEVLGRRGAGFELETVRVGSTGHQLRLEAVFRYRPRNVRVTRHVAVADGSPTFEVWTTFEPLGPEVLIEDVQAFEVQVPNGTVRSLTGLRGESADVVTSDVFLRQAHHLEPGEGIAFGADGRSSERTVPWFVVDGENDAFFTALLWSGAWRADMVRTGDTLSIWMGLPGLKTKLTTRPIEGPHALIGVTWGGLPQVSAALQAFIVNGLRNGRGFAPLVAFNPWFADGTRITEESMRDRMRHVAGLGTELFVLDAGWYVGAGAHGMFDFDSGLGTWKVDATRFPSGLAALGDYAHELGMRFGVWVEPERIDLDRLREAGLDELALATSDGRHVTDRTGQICLAGPGQAWVLERLTSFIDQVRPDYLKWDNNAWLNCDRDGHGHGAADGNFAHVTALYAILAALRERYPDLIIENVSGGGNRLDVGMLRYSDVGWMNDRSAPGSLVRRNAQGLSLVFPPAYLFSFVTQQDASETLTQTADISLIVRSRMLGALGMSFAFPGISVTDEVASELAIYKRIRSILTRAAGALLSEQAALEGGPPWDVFQTTTASGDASLLFAFQGDRGSGGLRVVLGSLDPEAHYAVESVDAGPLGIASGTDLMIEGIEIFPSPHTAAHILILTRVEASPESLSLGR